MLFLILDFVSSQQIIFAAIYFEIKNSLNIQFYLCLLYSLCFAEALNFYSLIKITLVLDFFNEKTILKQLTQRRKEIIYAKHLSI